MPSLHGFESGLSIETKLFFLDIPNLMQTQHKGSNKEKCHNHGYLLLNSNVKRWFSTDQGPTGNDKYGNNARCYWQFYAPGAKKIRIELTKIEVNVSHHQ